MTEFDHGDIIYVKDLDARIAYLQGVHPEERDEFEDEELEALVTFRKHINGTWGNGTQSLVSDSYWEQYAETHANDIYGEATETPYWNDEHWSLDLRAGHEAVMWDGQVYWGDGS